MELIIIIFVAACFGFICEYLGKAKGQKGCFLYGALLGIFGIIIVLCLKDKTKEIQEVEYTNKYEQLAKLQNLKENGTITEVEFEMEKAKLLR